MMMNMSENMLLFRYCSPLLLIFLFLFPQICCGLQNPSRICSASACGHIRNISFPFRLKNDPQHCGLPDYELSCENNVTTIPYLNSHKYRVKAINYINGTMRVSDVSVNNNICSFPYFSLDQFSLPYFPYNNTDISLMRCPYPLKNSSLFTHELPTHCHNSSTHTYIKLGDMNATDVGDMCTVYPRLTSWAFKDLENVSVSEIHDSLLYGFQLYWAMGSPNYCITCHGGWIKCPHKMYEVVSCRHGLGGMLDILESVWDHIKYPDSAEYVNYPTPTALLILLLILVVVFAGVTLPVKIILGFASPFLIIGFNQHGPYVFLHHIFWFAYDHPPVIIGLFFAVRFIIVFPFAIWFFIYKFRRSRLSRFSAIEDFLQSDNNLMPIRYSYSNIKKMSRSFREKLGQGGYGTVYKGKLRSGYDVAVKLLKKSGGNGQDFMNEISTIGRIHHVNIVKLVGYCAERSKRALVFDYMPNGSLDKYLYSRENTNSLSWERKHEIAIGVARGIEYLHRGCDIQILHFDIKPHNILLDDNFTPKITDFGLAKFFSTDKTVVTMTAIRGTIGYVAPELINRGFGEVSYKADVYSFGMLLMEMVGLNKDMKRDKQASSQYFPCWIYDCFEQGHDIEYGATDENNNDDNMSDSIANKMVIVALWCIQTSPGDRPSMNKVVEMLETPVERLRVPNRPPQSTQVAVNYENQSWSTYSTDATSLLGQDVAPNFEITIED
ncbi:hypothetical protein ACS0TY_025883 [Phlomoides rotata]